MKRIQIHLDEELDEVAQREAKRRGISKAALIRNALSRELNRPPMQVADPWSAMVGWLEDGPVEDLDQVIYEERR